MLVHQIRTKHLTIPECITTVTDYHALYSQVNSSDENKTFNLKNPIIVEKFENLETYNSSNLNNLEVEKTYFDFSKIRTAYMNSEEVIEIFKLLEARNYFF